MFSKLPMFSRMGNVAFKKDLTNTWALCEVLGHPQKKISCIHIAGTNGKGSVSHMLASILQHASYKTGLYTSPHLKDFRERIKVNGEMCPEKFVVDFIEKIKPHIETIQPSFFEITVAMAFDYFEQAKVDIAVIETGLGGRLDSTNVIIPILSIITQIGFDHTNLLGNTLQEIATEKAGIIKENIPVIIGEMGREATQVFEKVSREKNAPLFQAAKLNYVQDWQFQNNHLQVNVVNTATNNHEDFSLDLPGIYQLKNILPVVESVHQLKQWGWKISLPVLKRALSTVKKTTGLHGRWERIRQSPDVILDVAHNVDGIRVLKEQLEYCTYRRLHIIFGMVNDKDTSQILQALPKQAHYYFTKASIPRAMPEQALAEKAAANGLQGKSFSNVHEALQDAKKNAHTEDLILICGSVFLIAVVDTFEK